MVKPIKYLNKKNLILKIDDRKVDILWTEFEYKRAIEAPRIPPKPVIIWALVACQRSKPDFKRIAKSPISWGISWIIIPANVVIPTKGLTAKLPPIAAPCVKLSIKFANKFK